MATALAKKLTTQLGLGGLSMLTLLIISLLSLPACNQAPNSSSNPLKAAIVDQLYSLQPNEAFISEVTKELEDYGFEVDLYQGDEVTVDFYRQLPGYGYKLIIFRSHSGLLERKGELLNRTSLFTNEPYSKAKYISEQVTDQLVMAQITERNPWVFAIGPKFITQSMDERFDNTFIIMMGCSCLYLDDLAQAFLEKGASIYLGWNASVDLSYVDHATIRLVQHLCGTCPNEITVKEAASRTMLEVGPDPRYNAYLKYFPLQSGSRTIAELMIG